MLLSRLLRSCSVLCLLGSPAILAQSQPVGMIVAAQGSVNVERGGQRMTARPAQLLYAQDRLNVASGSITIVYCPSSERVTLLDGVAVLLGPDQLQATGGTPTRAPLGRCSLPQVALDAASVERVGAVRVRESGIPAIPLFLGGKIRQGNPSLQWQPVADADRYQVSVRRAAAEPIWETTTTASQAQFPAQESLGEGYYEWQVDALLGNRIIATQSTRFEVVPGTSEALPEEPLLAVVLLQTEGYFSEAANLIRPMWEQNPTDPSLKQQLTWLYLEAGLKDAADLVGKQ